MPDNENHDSKSRDNKGENIEQHHSDARCCDRYAGYHCEDRADKKNRPNTPVCKPTTRQRMRLDVVLPAKVAVAYTIFNISQVTCDTSYKIRVMEPDDAKNK